MRLAIDAHLASRLDECGRIVDGVALALGEADDGGDGEPVARFPDGNESSLADCDPLGIRQTLDAVAGKNRLWEYSEIDAFAFELLQPPNRSGDIRGDVFENDIGLDARDSHALQFTAWARRQRERHG